MPRTVTKEHGAGVGFVEDVGHIEVNVGATREAEAGTQIDRAPGNIVLQPRDVRAERAEVAVGVVVGQLLQSPQVLGQKLQRYVRSKFGFWQNPFFANAAHLNLEF